MLDHTNISEQTDLKGFMMSDIIGRAKAHYKEKLNAEQRVIEVEEWGEDGNPLLIYVKPANLVVRDKIYKYAAQGSLEALVESIILRAVDADGLPIFAKKDKNALMTSVDPDVIARISSEISLDLDIDGEDPVVEAGK